MDGLSLGSPVIVPAECTITHHALVRAKEHLGLAEERAKRLVKKAWTRGASISDVTLVRLREFLQHRDGRFTDGQTQFRVYQKTVFIFTPAGVLVTLYPLPARMEKAPHYIGKERYRNFRQYERAMRASADCEYTM